MKKHYRAIVLLYASDNQPIYQFFRRMIQAHMFECPEIKVFFAYGDNISTFDPQEYDIINEGIPDTFIDGIHRGPFSNPMVPMIRKTVNSVEKIYQTHTSDFFIRSSMGTFWLWDRLLKTLDTLPLTGCLAGALGGSVLKPGYAHGTGLTVNGYMAEQLPQRQNELFTPERLGEQTGSPYGWCGRTEDRELSHFFETVLGAELIGLPGLVNLSEMKVPNEAEISAKLAAWIDVNPEKDHVKIKNTADRMAIDTLCAKMLCKKYYGKDIAWDFEHHTPLTR